VYVFTVISMICDICSGVISFFLICMCNVAISTVLMYCFVTLVRLSLVTNKSYLLTYLHVTSVLAKRHKGAFKSVQYFAVHTGNDTTRTR